ILAVSFAASDAGLRRLLAADEHARAIESIAQTTFGRPLALRVFGPPEGGPTGATVTSPQPAGTPATTNRAEESRQELTDRAKKDPTVNRVLNEFGAQVVDVRPLHPSSGDAGGSGQGEENG